MDYDLDVPMCGAECRHVHDGVSCLECTSDRDYDLCGNACEFCGTEDAPYLDDNGLCLYCREEMIQSSMNSYYFEDQSHHLITRDKHMLFHVIQTVEDGRIPF